VPGEVAQISSDWDYFVELILEAIALALLACIDVLIAWWAPAE
jgi:hypothetical protein